MPNQIHLLPQEPTYAPLNLYCVHISIAFPLHHLLLWQFDNAQYSKYIMNNKIAYLPHLIIKLQCYAMWTRYIFP